MITVVCTGGENQLPISPCLAWLDASHRTIAADGGIALLKALGRKADLWIGDGDSLGGPLSDWSDWYKEARLLNKAKDDSDTEAAVRVAAEEGAAEIWLLGGGGGRMDHWWANLKLVSAQPALTRWLTSHEETWVVGPGKPHPLLPGVVSIFPLGEGPWKVASSGLRWPLDRVDFSRWHSLSNEASDGATLTVERGRFLILHPWLQGALP